MVDHDRLRVWGVRIAAPVAFVVGATVLVLLIQNGLESGDATTATPGAALVAAPAATGAGGSAAGTTATTTAAKKKNYRVKAGDTLESIAERFDTTVDDLLQLNPSIDPLALTPGQKIRVR